MTGDRRELGANNEVGAAPRIELEGALAMLDLDTAKRLSAPAARAYGALVLRIGDGLAQVAFERPSRNATNAVAALLGIRVEPRAADAATIARGHEFAYGPRRVRQADTRERRSNPDELTRRDHVAARTGASVISLRPVERSQGPAKDPVDGEAARLLGRDLCRSLGVLPVRAHEDSIEIATANPLDPVAERLIRAVTTRAPTFLLATPSDMAAAMERAFPTPKPPQPAVEALTPPKKPDRPAPGAEPAPRPPAPATPVETGARAARPRIGDLLLTRGLITPADLERAVSVQDRTGDRLGQILLHVSAVGEEPLAATLAEQSLLMAIDLDAVTPAPEALAILPEHVMRAHRVVPLEIVDGVLCVAMIDALDEAAVAAIREHTDLPLRITMARPSAIDRLLQRQFTQQQAHHASNSLFERFPEDSARFVVSRAQRIVLTSALLLFFVAAAVAPIPTLVSVAVASVTIYLTLGLYRFWLVYRSAGNPGIIVDEEEIAALDEATLPTYTILVPLYDEAQMIPTLVDSLSKLDYPPTKLDVKLLLEADDEESLKVVDEITLPPHVHPLVVPDTNPKTKPKACNYGLLYSRGEMVVVYDAEDEPDPDQLKKVVAALRGADERVVCAQCKLNYYNRNQNMLTKWFTTEYAMWFDLLLPGLDASDVAIPLGGTSNHFMKDRLVELGGWDPFNVTEDADLGIRLHHRGLRTIVVDSTTLEEANADLATGSGSARAG